MLAGPKGPTQVPDMLIVGLANRPGSAKVESAAMAALWPRSADVAGAPGG
jgi:hypothetical protein